MNMPESNINNNPEISFERFIDLANLALQQSVWSKWRRAGGVLEGAGRPSYWVRSREYQLQHIIPSEYALVCRAQGVDPMHTVTPICIATARGDIQRTVLISQSEESGPRRRLREPAGLTLQSLRIVISSETHDQPTLRARPLTTEEQSGPYQFGPPMLAIENIKNEAFTLSTRADEQWHIECTKNDQEYHSQPYPISSEIGARLLSDSVQIIKAAVVSR